MEHLLTIWPSIAALAADLGKPYPTVQAWGVRGRRIPPSAFPEIISAAKLRGADLTYDQLVAQNRADTGTDTGTEMQSRSGNFLSQGAAP